MWVDRNGEIYEFTLISDLYDEDEKGESILVKEDVTLKHTCSVSIIDAVTQTFNHDGKIRKDRCKLTLRDGSTLTVKGSYPSIREVVFPMKGSSAHTGFNFKHE